ncbi:hypothetical protein PISMIDRAFT_508877 [Pisolithus microcarpus 441]|uniref:Unplaced genomic scaffold scaffold_576, whole genome shotgun sequence n=1 Tax=Pisolithus microcarpus 441 TaxID=765257 RepID=A0A0C9YTP6_9AGAM|nr:hypothetical protein PISMIDRAFT_508877 [Pisolithus microcarpus 441]
MGLHVPRATDIMMGPVHMIKIASCSEFESKSMRLRITSPGILLIAWISDTRSPRMHEDQSMWLSQWERVCCREFHRIGPYPSTIYLLTPTTSRLYNEWFDRKGNAWRMKTAGRKAGRWEKIDLRAESEGTHSL